MLIIPLGKVPNAKKRGSRIELTMRSIARISESNVDGNGDASADKEQFEHKIIKGSEEKAEEGYLLWGRLFVGSKGFFSFLEVHGSQAVGVAGA